MRNAFLLVAVIVLVILTQVPIEVLAKRPPPPPPEPVTAEDVVCDGCVGTTDIEDGSVTTQKLSADVQNEINQLRTDVNTLQAFPHGVLKYFDGNDTFVGNYISGVIYHPDAKVFLGLEYFHAINIPFHYLAH